MARPYFARPALYSLYGRAMARPRIIAVTTNITAKYNPDAPWRVPTAQDIPTSSNLIYGMQIFCAFRLILRVVAQPHDTFLRSPVIMFLNNLERGAQKSNIAIARCDAEQPENAEDFDKISRIVAKEVAQSRCSVAPRQVGEGARIRAQSAAATLCCLYAVNRPCNRSAVIDGRPSPLATLPPSTPRTIYAITIYGGYALPHRVAEETLPPHRVAGRLHGVKYAKREPISI